MDSRVFRGGRWARRARRAWRSTKHMGIGVAMALGLAPKARAQECSLHLETGAHTVVCPFLGLVSFNPVAANSSGLVVGYRVSCPGDGGRHPVVWQAGEAHAQDLDIGLPCDTAECVDVTESGVILGVMDLTDGISGNTRGFLYDWHTGELTLLFPPPGDHSVYEKIQVYDINESLQWVGAMTLWDGDGYTWLKPFRAVGNEYEFLDVSDPELPPEQQSGEARGIASDGRVCGWRYVGADYAFRGVVWEAEGWSILPPLDGDLTSRALAVNARGETLVRSQGGTSEDRHAYVRHADGTMEQVVAPNGSTNLKRIHGMNEAGEVLVQELWSPLDFIWKDSASWHVQDAEENPESMNHKPVALSPNGDVVFEMYDYGMVAIGFRTPRGRDGDIDRNCAIGASDLLSLLMHWSSADEVHDLDRSGEVDWRDLLILLSNWTEGG